MTVTVHREPPTALGLARDLSGNKERASAAPDGRRLVAARVCGRCESFPCRCTAESLLEKRCVCGGIIRATTVLPTDILFAVQSHNRTPRHDEWRRLTGR